MLSAVLFLCLLALVRGQTTNVQQCLYQGGDGSLPINTYIAGCPAPPCSFAQGTVVELEVIFRSPKQIHSMQTLAYAYLFGPIGAPYPLGNEAVTCDFLSNTYCPLLAGEIVVYNLRMLIEEWMPAGTSVTVEFVIQDLADSSIVACLRTPIAITPPLSRGVGTNGTISVTTV